MTSTAQTVRVALNAPAADRSYDVVIGQDLLASAGEMITPLLQRPRVAVVSDSLVMGHHGETLKKSLSTQNIEASFFSLPPGEATKSFSHLNELLEGLIAEGIERSDLIIAFGGGVIGDLVGLAAALLRRGCRFVQIPTTLLAQVDSSVGGKTAINATNGKNLIGAFHQPSLVIADISLLSTLPTRHLLAGYAEVVKYGALGDRQFFDWLSAHGKSALSSDKEALANAVETSVVAKAAIVAEDETEQGRRKLLNLGHTFGHAFEAAFGYSDAVLHGEAVALGMTLAFRYSVRRGHCSAQEAKTFEDHLSAVGLPSRLSDLPNSNADLSPSNLVRLMAQDKKMSAGKLSLILARSIGDAFIADGADFGDLEDFLTEMQA
ncbi:MAG: 3-dehydroquinate synthase [Pseudomonadota bacterium]